MASTTQTAIGTAVRIELQRAGRTQRDLANALGITPATLSHWLSGRTPIGLDRVDAIAHELDLADAFELLKLGRAELIRQAQARTERSA